MVDGRWLMRNGQVLTMDEPGTVREAREVIERAWGRYFRQNPHLELPGGFAVDMTLAGTN